MAFYSVVEKNGQKELANLAGATRGEGCPLGSIIAYPSNTLPNGNWLFCDGSTFDETKYPALYLLLGSNKVPNMNKIIRYDYENPQTFPGNSEINWTATSDGLFYPFPYASSGNAYSAYITINGVTYNLGQANSNYNSAVFELKKGDVIRMYGDWSSRTDTRFIPAITCNCIIKATSNMNESEATGILNLINQRESYSTDEINTGKKWIDGKPIYSKTISVNISLAASGQWYNTNIKLPNVDVSVSCSNFISDSSYPAKIIRSTVPGMFTTNTSDDVMVHSFHVTGTLKYIALEYTKTTD